MNSPKGATSRRTLQCGEEQSKRIICSRRIAWSVSSRAGRPGTTLPCAVIGARHLHGVPANAGKSLTGAPRKLPCPSLSQTCRGLCVNACSTTRSGTPSRFTSGAEIVSEESSEANSRVRLSLADTCNSIRNIRRPLMTPASSSRAPSSFRSLSKSAATSLSIKDERNPEASADSCAAPHKPSCAHTEGGASVRKTRMIWRIGERVCIGSVRNKSGEFSRSLLLNSTRRPSGTVFTDTQLEPDFCLANSLPQSPSKRQICDSRRLNTRMAAF